MGSRQTTCLPQLFHDGVEWKICRETGHGQWAVAYQTSRRRWEWRTEGGGTVLLAYRIVFTMKRTMTARPTQPHITPITMAVTSPAQKDAQRVDLEKKTCQDSRLKMSVMFGSINCTVVGLLCHNVSSLVQCDGCRAQSHQKRAPSLSLQQNNKSEINEKHLFWIHIHPYIPQYTVLTTRVLTFRLMVASF